MLHILLSPKSFFETCAGSEPSLKKPAVIIFLMSILTAITGYLIGEITGKLLSGFMEGIGLITAISTAVSSFLAPWFIWLVIAVVLMVMTRILKGTGSFKRYAEIAGYSMLPQLIGAVISVILGFWYLPRIQVSPIKVADPTQIQTLMTDFFKNPLMQEYSLLSTTLSVILLIWTANIAAIGLEKCCGLTSKQAMIAAGLPIAVYILYSLYTLITMLGWL
ncbi:Yip1 family protein [uncultured Methanospirillum sp.]|uniref:Yip1 family protein n=1 Tax=uncultured Methanospirillum sp. TaxID=262503 RepID=UPI0029C6FAB3|nr:Yip1 family protein [uncultured Methanospirillum sp.]